MPQRRKLIEGDPLAPTAKRPSSRKAKRRSTSSSTAGRGRVAKESPPNALVKATFYLREDQVLGLDEERLRRLRRGLRIDKSALVREALDRLLG